jgi:hypothetical protein
VAWTYVKIRGKGAIGTELQQVALIRIHATCCSLCLRTSFSRNRCTLSRDMLYVTKHLQQGIESDYFRVKKNMPKIGGFQSFNTVRRTIAGFEAMLWLRKGFGFSAGWTVNDQNDLLARLFGLQEVNKA